MSEENPRAMRKRGVLWRLLQIPDEIGGASRSHTVEGVVFIDLRPVSPSQRRTSDGVLIGPSWRARLRAREIAPGWKLEAAGRAFVIRSVLPDREAENYINLELEELLA